MAASKKPAAPKRVASKAPAKKTPPKSQSQTSKNFWPKDVKFAGTSSGITAYGNGVYSNRSNDVTLPRLKSKPHLLGADGGRIISDGNINAQTRFSLNGADGPQTSRQGAISAARQIKASNYKQNGTTKSPTKRGGKK
jgi:hypothetical protein